MGMKKKFRLSYRKQKVTKSSLNLTLSLPVTNYYNAPFSSLYILRKRLQSIGSLPKAWLDIDDDLSAAITFRKLCNFEHNIFMSFKIYTDGAWKLSLASKVIDPVKCTLLREVSKRMKSVSDVLSTLKIIDDSYFCYGNSEPIFCNMQLTSDAFVLDAITLPTTTVRHKDCEVLMNSSLAMRCQSCAKYRITLKKYYTRKIEQSTSIATTCTSHVNYRYLDPCELKKRLHNMHNSLTMMKVKIARLEKLKQSIIIKGVQLDEARHTDMVELMESSNKKVHDNYSETSFQRIFWDQQQKAAMHSNSKSMRWHPLMIKWCLYMRHCSSRAYETLRSSGVLQLPSQRTLRDYTHYIKAACGFSVEVDNDLLRAANYFELKEWEKNVGLIIDEVHIKEDLVYDKHSGTLIGFISLGDVNDKLLQFERSLNDSSENAPPPLANTIYVFMVRGLFTSLQYPYVQLACKDLTGELLFQPFWEAVFRLEKCGFQVLFATFDGALVNRKLIKLHGLTSKELTHKVINPYSSESRYLYFISDPPHLMKTTRNCWFNNNLWCRGKSISWRHLELLYLKNSGAHHEVPGLSLVPKLKYEHINLTNFSKMRVDLAAQVLSESVSKAIELTGGPDAKETSIFCDMFDKFFDCLNVRDYNSGKLQRKPFLNPYHSATDFRLQWLENVFLTYLNDWEKSVKERDGHTAEEKRKMLISTETRTGLMITVKSFVELTCYIFSIPGVKSFLSEKLSQDPLEKFFGCQRQRCGTHENPNVKEFCNGAQALRVINTFCKDPIKGNCRGNTLKRPIDFDKESLPLPKRKK